MNRPLFLTFMFENIKNYSLYLLNRAESDLSNNLSSKTRFFDVKQDKRNVNFLSEVQFEILGLLLSYTELHVCFVIATSSKISQGHG